MTTLSTILSFIFAAAEDGENSGKAIALGVGGGLGAVGAGVLGVRFRLGEDKAQDHAEGVHGVGSF